jgi:integrase/recombinase XerD
MINDNDYFKNVIPENRTLITEYLDDAEVIGLTSNSIANYRSCLKVFARFISKNLTGVGMDDLKLFKRHLEKERRNRYGDLYAPASIDRYFSAIQSFFEFLEFEGHIESNPMKCFRKRYLRDYRRKKNDGKYKRKLISVQEMSMLVNSIMEPRDKAVVLLYAKTGCRRNEIINVDIDDIDWVEQSIMLKPSPKRSNLLVFFDDETARVLKRWLISRENWKNNGTKALFLNERGGRLNRNGVYEIFTKHAAKVGLHNPNSNRLQDRFTTHCARLWFTNHLRRRGMPREHRMELRGDSRNQGIDHYEPIDKKELRESYLAHIPHLGI